MLLTFNLICFDALAPLDLHPITDLDKVINKLRIKYRTYYVEFDAGLRDYMFCILNYSSMMMHIFVYLFSKLVLTKKSFVFRVLQYYQICLLEILVIKLVVMQHWSIQVLVERFNGSFFF